MHAPPPRSPSQDGQTGVFGTRSDQSPAADGLDGPVVTALLVVRLDAAGAPDPVALLDATCSALIEQTRPPDRLVLIDATAGRTMRGYLDTHPRLSDSYPQVSVVVVPPDAPFAAIVDTAVDALPEPGEDLVVPRRSAQRAGRRPVRARDRRHWLWLLHEDSSPDVTALAELTAATAQSERVGIAGCKVVDAADPRVLLDIGTEVTRSGRHLAGDRSGEPDQGQHDERRDVLAVSSAGMLVRQDTYNSLGGFDPAFDGSGDGLDLGWRAHLIGHSVVVVPGARVRQIADGSSTGPAILRRHRQVALARASLLGMPWLAVWTTLSSLLLALILLVGKRPRRAGVELIQATAPLGVLRILGARRRFFRRATTRRRNLRGLFVPVLGAAYAQWEGLHDAPARTDLSCGDSAVDPAQSSGDGSPSGAGGTGPLPPEAGGRRGRRGVLARSLFGPAGLVVLLLAVAGAVLWRHLLTGGALDGGGRGLTGGQLLPFDTDATGIWQTYRDAWTGPGLGHPSSPTPYLAVLAPLVWLVGVLPWVQQSNAGAVTVAWLLLAVMPSAGLVAYRAGRVVTTARWPRVAVALLWGVLPTLTTAIAQGRIGPVIGHILLPFALAGVLATARRGAGTASAFGAVLAVAVVGAFAPVLLLACSVVALVAVVVAPGVGRARELAVLILPWLLLAPWTRQVLTGDHRMLLAGPGALDSARGLLARPWELALLHPGGAGSYAVLASVPVLVIGLLGLLRSGLGRAGAALIGVGVLGLGAALAAPHVLLAGSGQGTVTPWTGSALDVYAFALLGAGLMGMSAGGTLRWRRWTAGATTLACAGGLVVGGFAVWTATPTSLSAAPEQLPPVVQRQLTSDRAPRALLLGVDPGGSVSYRLIGREAGLPARDLRSPYPSYDARTAAAVTALTTRGRAQDSTQLLQRLAVGYVVVRGPAAVRALRPGFGGSGGLTELANTRSMILWRVEPAASASGAAVPVSRVSLTQGGRPAAALGSRPQHGHTVVSLPAGGEGRALVLSEGSGWIDRGRVMLNGRLLSASLSAGRPTYALPPGGGRLSVQPGVANHRLPWAQLALLILVVYLAVPFGTRRPRPGSLGGR